MPRSPSPVRCFLLLPPVALLAVLASGCGDADVATPNQPPDTVIEAGPPEGGDTSYRVSFAWSGSDPDGEVSHFEFTFDDDDHWHGPLTGRDSSFVVRAAGDCCGDELPGFDPPLPDSVWEQWHTFRVRAVDAEGEPDPTPAARSFNAKTIAPYTEITSGPGWPYGPPTFTWEGRDDDGTVAQYRYAVATLEDYFRDTGESSAPPGRVIAWLDTLVFYPDYAGGYFRDSLVWTWTLNRSATLHDLPGPAWDTKVFAVRALDNAGAEERVLTPEVNVRFFTPPGIAEGPIVQLHAGYPGARLTSEEPPEPVHLFSGTPYPFRFRAVPPSGGAAVASCEYSPDGSAWIAVDPSFGGYTVNLPAGSHSFHVRARGTDGVTTVLSCPLTVHRSPRDCAPDERHVLVVLDTDPHSMQVAFLWPPEYEAIERTIFPGLLDGYPVVVHETHALAPPDPDLLRCASAVIWFRSANYEATVFETMFGGWPNLAEAYVAGGGNLLVCGIGPTAPARQFGTWWGPPTLDTGSIAADFGPPDDPAVDEPSWAWARFGIAHVDRTVGNTNIGQDAQYRLARATSRITSGPNPYPDLPFDPLTWPQGTVRRGFGFYDLGLEVVPGSGAEVLYTANDSDDAVAVRRLAPADGSGSVIWLGLHPYFVERPAFRAFLRAALADFGVLPEG